MFMSYLIIHFVSSIKIIWSCLTSHAIHAFSLNNGINVSHPDHVEITISLLEMSTLTDTGPAL